MIFFTKLCNMLTLQSNRSKGIYEDLLNSKLVAFVIKKAWKDFQLDSNISGIELIARVKKVQCDITYIM